MIGSDGRFAYDELRRRCRVSLPDRHGRFALSLEDATAGLTEDGRVGLRDEDLSDDGRFLYTIDTDQGEIAGWAVGDGGSLSKIGPWGGVPTTVAGLAAIDATGPLLPGDVHDPRVVERHPGGARRDRGTELPDRRRSGGGWSLRELPGANFPRRRVDGALEPSFRGVLETDDGASILFRWDGLARLTPSGMRQLLGAMFHVATTNGTAG